MKENHSFAAAVQDRWLRGRRRKDTTNGDESSQNSGALAPLQRTNTSVSGRSVGGPPHPPGIQRGRSRVAVRHKTPPRARTWSPKPSARLETRLGITPTHYAVDELYIGESPEGGIDKPDHEAEDDPTDDLSSQASSIFMEDRHSLYSNIWEESEGLIADTFESGDASQQPQLMAPKITPPFRRQAAQALQTPIPVGLFRRNHTSKPDSHRRAREIIDKAYSRDAIPITPCSSSGSISSVTSVASCVEIFLLLVEPNSKVFELIELSYPRRTTTIAKILKMIPKNVSDPVLAEQKYVGLCRPKKNSEPITELKAFASSSVASSGPTANICQGDIFIAIPANTSSRQMIQLAKPIVANPHIQKLMASSHPTPKVLVKRQSRYSSSNNVTSTASKDISTCSTTTTTTNTSYNSVTPVVDETPVSNTRTPGADKHLVNRDIFCSDKADAYFQYCEQEMKRAVAQANFDNDGTVYPTPTPPPRPMVHVVTPPAAEATSRIYNNVALRGDRRKTERSSWDDDASHEVIGAVHSFQSMLGKSNSYRPYVVHQRAHLTRKRRALRLLRWIRRAVLVLLGLAVLYYLSDSTRLENDRLQAVHRPLGFQALLATILTFVALVKLQRFYLIPMQHSRCPVMQTIVAQMDGHGSTTTTSPSFRIQLK